MNFENLQLSVAELPKAEEMAFTPLHKDYKSVRLIVVMLFTALLFGVGVCVVVFNDFLFNLNEWLLGLGIPLLYLIVAVFFVYKSFIPKGYVIREKDIAYRSGFIYHSITVVPYNRIQHCEVTQGPIEKAFDLSRIMVYTAGGGDSELVIPGLLYEDGEKLREHLLKQIASNAVN